MKVIAEKVGNRIYLRTPFAYKDQCKAIIGARWSKQARAWTYPLDLETARQIREAFGDNLELGSELTEWGHAQVVREKGLHALNNVQDINIMSKVDVPRIRLYAPTMWEAMMARPYQPVAAQFMAEARRCLNGDQPGIGKTIETLGALIAAEVKGPVLVLAPRTSCNVVWANEIPKWYADDIPYTVTQTAGLSPAKREVAYNEFLQLCDDYPTALNFLIANAEQVGIKVEDACPADICNGDEDWCPAFDRHTKRRIVRRPFLHDITWSAVIADETHKWLINTRGKKASQVGYGFTRLKVADDGPMYALSGTPLKGKKYNLFGTLNWLWPKTYTSKWRWLDQYFVITEDEHYVKGGGGATKKVKVIGDLDANRQEAFFRSLNSIMIRRTKDELRKINPDWMPPEKRYHDVWVDMEPAQKRKYMAMEKSAEVETNGVMLTATGILAILTRLRQFANSDADYVNGKLVPMMPSAKFNWLLEFLEERGIEAKHPNARGYGDLSDDVRKVVIASQFTTSINAWAAELVGKGIQCYVLTGETSDKKREEYQQAFQTKDDVRVFFINTTAGGVSITLDAADDMVIMDETWVPDEQEQVEDRVHRASNVKHQVDVWYVRTRDTIEEGLAKVNADKAKSNHVVLDAQRGLRFATERFGAVIKVEK